MFIDAARLCLKPVHPELVEGRAGFDKPVESIDERLSPNGLPCSASMAPEDHDAHEPAL